MFVNNRVAIRRPLDLVPGAWLAASIARRVNSSYTGPLVRVRRDGDNAELDIGQAGQGVLDMEALDTFVGGLDGWLTTIYDQSGNGYDLTSAAAANQGQIVDGNTLKIKGLPHCQFDGSTDRVVYDTGGTLNHPASFVVAFRPYFHGDFDCVLDGAGNGGSFEWAFHQVAAGTTYGLYGGGIGGDTYTLFAPLPVNVTYVASMVQNGIGNSRLEINQHGAEAQISPTGAGDGLSIACPGNRSASEHCSMAFYEVLMYTSALSNANRTLLHRNMDGYYRVY
jgi:hypothetical protein